MRADERFELAAPAPLTLVCFRHRAGDEVNQRILDRLKSTPTDIEPIFDDK